MNETRTVADPFLCKNVEVSDKLTDRLRGRYAIGPAGPDGEPEFGWRQMPTAPIQIEAAARIDELQARLDQIADIAEGSRTANSLPHIAKIARGVHAG